MFNPYVIILVLFVFAGLATSVWGWIMMSKGRKTRHWPATEGTIEESSPTSKNDELMPHIEFSYKVMDIRYRRVMEFASGTHPSRELSASYTRKYPVGARVEVFYDPEQPERAALEPGAGRDDWLIFAIGVSATLFGIALLFFSG